jgi:hypothetical protein
MECVAGRQGATDTPPAPTAWRAVEALTLRLACDERVRVDDDSHRRACAGSRWRSQKQAVVAGEVGLQVAQGLHPAIAADRGQFRAHRLGRCPTFLTGSVASRA